MLSAMRWFVFFALMALSWQGVKLLPWPGWAQIVVLLAVNLVVGALLWPSDQAEQQPGQEPR
jgi:hypothetical protein